MIKLDLNPPAKDLRVFAWATLILFPVFGAMISGWHWTSPIVLILGAIGLAQAICILVISPLLTRLLWVILAPPSFLIGMVVSHVLLGVIFYLVMTPIGLVFKLIGRDAMHRRFDRGVASYWTVRSTERSPTTYFRLY